MNKVSAIISTVPWTDTDGPMLAPAVLKTSLTTEGIGSETIDLNAEIRRWLFSDVDCVDDVVHFFLTEEVRVGSQNAIKSAIDRMASRLLQFDCEWILLSLLTYLSQIPTKWLCFRLKQIKPETKIVIGGPGAAVSLKSMQGFAEEMLASRLIDFYITGDGEQSLPALLRGDTSFPGINSNTWQQIQEINTGYFPNFDDYDWNLYDAKRIPIVGSRGCVRTCTFCDIHEHWSRFQYRTGENIFAEIKSQYERYGIDTYMFSDSLVNGNQKEFRDLISRLAEHNQTHSSRPVKWSGSFIVRPREQMKEQDWDLIRDSGCVMLSVGIESFVEHIRYHIGKKFSNHDLDYVLEMGKKKHIPMVFMLIIGYVTETDKDIEESMSWIREHRHFAGNPIYSVEIGSGLGILPGTWLDRNKENLNITMGSGQVLQDWSRMDNDSTPVKRLKWHETVQQELEANGFKTSFVKDNHVIIQKYLHDTYRS